MNPTATLSLKHLTRFPKQPAETYPTVICFHGRGSNEADLIGLAPALDDRLLWISPRAPLDLMGGYEWYRLEDVGVPNQATFDAAVETLDQFVAEAVGAYPVDARRLFLLGFSQGSMMSYSFALTRPGRVAGVIAQSGYIPLNSLNTTWKVDEAGVKGKPFILTHGTQDQVIPVEWGRQARDTLVGLGAEVEYREFPMGHMVSEASLAAIAAWLQNQLSKEK